MVLVWILVLLSLRWHQHWRVKLQHWLSHWRCWIQLMSFLHCLQRLHWVVVLDRNFNRFIFDVSWWWLVLRRRFWDFYCHFYDWVGFDTWAANCDVTVFLVLCRHFRGRGYNFQWTLLWILPLRLDWWGFLSWEWWFDSSLVFVHVFWWQPCFDFLLWNIVLDRCLPQLFRGARSWLI